MKLEVESLKQEIKNLEGKMGVADHTEDEDEEDVSLCSIVALLFMHYDLLCLLAYCLVLHRAFI